MAFDGTLLGSQEFATFDQAVAKLLKTRNRKTYGSSKTNMPVSYAVGTWLTLKRVLLTGVNHIEDLNGQHRVTINQNIVGMAHKLVSASDATASILSR